MEHTIEEVNRAGVRPHWMVKVGPHAVASYAFEDWGGRDAAYAAAQNHGEEDDWDECPLCGRQSEHSHAV